MTGAAGMPSKNSVVVERILPLFLLLTFLVQCAWFIETQSLTVDEPSHIISGQHAWRGDLTHHMDNPPLPRLLMTLLLPNPPWTLEGSDDHDITSIEPNVRSLARRARWMNVLLGAALAALIWLPTRSELGAGAANLALLLLAFSPSMVAHFSLATHDAPVAVTTLGVVLCLIRWQRQRTTRYAALLGFVVGLHLLTKLSALPSALLAIVLVLVLKPGGFAVRPAQWNWRHVLFVMGTAFFVIWAGYFFHLSEVTLTGGKIQMTFPNSEKTFTKNFPAQGEATFYVPAGELFAGFKFVSETQRRGFKLVLLGETHTQNRWYFLPAILLLKWPPVIIVLALLGLLGLFCKKIQVSQDWYVVGLFPLGLMLVAVFSGMHPRERWTLPVYPFLLLLGGATWNWARHRRLLAGGVVLLAGLLIADAWRIAPHYLAYLNPLVDPKQSHLILSDSNLDWGQGLLALRDFQEAHSGEEMHLAYFGSVDPSVYGIRAHPLPEGIRVSGSVAISATRLAGSWNQDPLAFRWVLECPRKEVVANIFHVHECPQQVHTSTPDEGARD